MVLISNDLIRGILQYQEIKSRPPWWLHCPLKVKTHVAKNTSEMKGLDIPCIFGSIVYNRAIVYIHQNFLKIVVGHVIIFDL